jgi:uncharacterized membrane protein
LTNQAGDPPVLANAAGIKGRRRQIGAALRRRRRLRVGIVQIVYVVAAIGLGLLVPRISVGASVSTSKATEMLVGVGAGFVPFIGIVYSMLFLVVQFGATNYTPRLNLFRDAPIVWHAFAFFTAVIVFSFTAALELGNEPHATLLVPIALGVAVLVAITLMRILQTTAFNSIQLASILDQISSRGRVVIDGVHPEPLQEAGQVANDAAFYAEQARDGQDVLWPGRSAVLQRLDVPRLLGIAEQSGARIDVCVAPGETISEGTRVAVVVDGPNLPDPDVLETFAVGPERTFDQDPAFALRLLADIALRALSSAVNDPTTATQSLDLTADLLGVLVRRDLGVLVVDDASGTPRIMVSLHTWEEYVSVALDEILAAGSNSVHLQRRLIHILEGLLAIAPAPHRAAIEHRLAAATEPSSPVVTG